MRFQHVLAAAIVLAALFSTSDAAPIFLQDYEAPGGLDEPFNRAPDASGSSEGILDDDAPNDPGTSAIALETADGTLGTTQSALITIVDEAPPAADSAGANGTAYHVRLIPNAGASPTATNPAFATDGFVGFYLKADPAAAAALLEVAPLLEDSGGTLAGSGGVLRPVIADGLWHLYEWDMDNPADFPNTFESFYGGTPAAETLDATASFDSIAILSRGVDGQSSAAIKIDQIGYNNEGHLPQAPIIPEPASLLLFACGMLSVCLALRRGAVR
jgi:hypothetical protein